MTNTSFGETLSAVVDGEASEFELRRVLADADFEQLRARGVRYQLQGALLRKEHNEFSTVDLTAGIHEALAHEEARSAEYLSGAQVQSTDIRFWQRPWARAGVAASVTLAVILGVNTYNRADLTGPVLARAEVAAPLVRSPEVEALQPVGAQSLLAGLNTQTPVKTERVEPAQVRLIESDQRQALRVQSYMRQHTAQTVLTSTQGALPFARVSSFDAR